MKAPAPQLRPRRIHPRAFLVLDLVIGLILALAMLMVMTVAVVKQQHAEKQLAAVRLAMRNAESAMLALQSGDTLPPGAVLAPLPDSAPAGYQWVRLTLPARDAPPATLIGLVPAAALHTGGAK